MLPNCVHMGFSEVLGSDRGETCLTLITMSLKTMCLAGLAKHQGSGEDGGEHMVEDLRAPSPKARLANPPLLEDHRLPSGVRQ